MFFDRIVQSTKSRLLSVDLYFKEFDDVFDFDEVFLPSGLLFLPLDVCGFPLVMLRHDFWHWISCKAGCAQGEGRHRNQKSFHDGSMPQGFSDLNTLRVGSRCERENSI